MKNQKSLFVPLVVSLTSASCSGAFQVLFRCSNTFTLKQYLIVQSITCLVFQSQLVVPRTDFHENRWKKILKGLPDLPKPSRTNLNLTKTKFLESRCWKNDCKEITTGKSSKIRNLDVSSCHDTDFGMMNPIFRSNLRNSGVQS